MKPFVFIIILKFNLIFPKHVVILNIIINTEGCIGLFCEIYLIVSKYCNMTQMKYYIKWILMKLVVRSSD
jgi:nitric oxide reductase large subunit